MNVTPINRELPGIERPTIKPLDAAIAPYLVLKAEHRSVTQKLTDAKAVVQKVMIEQGDFLEKNEDGEPCYMYRDGQKRHCATLEAGDVKLSVRPVKADEDTGGDIG